MKKNRSATAQYFPSFIFGHLRSLSAGQISAMFCGSLITALENSAETTVSRLHRNMLVFCAQAKDFSVYLEKLKC